MATTLSPLQLRKILRGEYKNPSSILGPQRQTVGGREGWVVRHFSPGAVKVELLRGRKAAEMSRVHSDGIFELFLDGREPPTDYRLRVLAERGKGKTFYDPYNPRFASQISAEALARFSGGDDFEAYELLGAHCVKNDGVAGVRFIVWAPNAKYVAVTGSFNGWHAFTHPMNDTRRNGLWELFIPGLAEGTMYKLVIRTIDGRTWVKADPYARHAQLRPKKSSIVWNADQFSWTDGKWMEERRTRQTYREPMSVYEVHLGSWIRKEDPAAPFFNYRELAEELIPYVREMGFTHIELMPVMEHPLDQSWGYQITSYFAPTSRFGTPSDFMHLVDACHNASIGVILDWVPAHFPRDPHGLGRFDGTHLYEHADPRQGFHPDWKTWIPNYGRNEVRSFLLSNANYWLDKFHVDGLRIDAVASMLYLDYSRKRGEWVPNRYGGNENLEAISFLKHVNAMVRERHPGAITIAEESTAWPGVTRPEYAGGLGFTYKWNMGWMHDTLEYFRRDPVYRKYHHNKLTFMVSYAFRETYHLVLSHDEVVHGKRSLVRKMPGDAWNRWANLRTLFGWMFAHPGKKTLFMGNEFAQFREWRESREIDWYLLEHDENKKIQALVRDLNLFYRREPALHLSDVPWKSFEWIDFRDADNSIVTFLRKGEGERDLIIFALNFTPEPRSGYRVGVPYEGFYREVFNTNAAIYGGTDAGNSPGRHAERHPNPHGRPCTITLDVPPLSMSAFKLEG